MAIQVTDNLILDVKKTIIQTIRAKQYDNDSRMIHITVVDGDTQIPLHGYGVMAKFQTSAGRSMIYNLTPNVDNTVDILLNEDMLYDSGKTQVEVVILDDEITLSSIPFQINVIPSVFDDEAKISESAFDVLIDTLRDVKEVIEGGGGAGGGVNITADDNNKRIIIS